MDDHFLYHAPSFPHETEKANQIWIDLSIILSITELGSAHEGDRETIPRKTPERDAQTTVHQRRLPKAIFFYDLDLIYSHAQYQ